MNLSIFCVYRPPGADMQRRLEVLRELGFTKALIQIRSLSGRALTPVQCLQAELIARKAGIQCQGWGWVVPHEAPDARGAPYHHWWLDQNPPIFDIEDALLWKGHGEAVRRYSVAGQITSFDRMRLHTQVTADTGWAVPARYYRQLYSAREHGRMHPEWKRGGWTEVPVLPVFTRSGSMLAQNGPTMRAREIEKLLANPAYDAVEEISCWSDRTLLGKNTRRRKPMRTQAARLEVLREKVRQLSQRP